MKTKTFLSRTLATGALVASIAIAGGVVRSAQQTGPSTSQSPYAVASVSGVDTKSLLSVGDAASGYRLVGLPDGLGAFDNDNGTFTVVMNHELGSTQGTNRVYGAIGAFVSKWVINKETLAVVSGSDLMQRIRMWDAVNQQSLSTHTPFAFNRFCSGDLPAVTAFFNAATGLGTKERIYMNGEEGSATGYILAHVVTGPDAGSSYVLGKLNLSTNNSGLVGVAASENALANPFAQDKTIVITTSDGGTGIMNNSVSVYVGTKRSTGTDADKAGLTNGTLKFINVTGNATEVVNTTTRATSITSGTRFTLSGTSSTAFSRPEDGQWNPLNPKQFYFVTTDQIDQVSDGLGAQVGQTRLWRLTFDDITSPDLGGVIDLLIDGRTVNGEKVNMFDNMTVNAKTGLLVLQEDTGGNAHNAKVWLYDPTTNVLTRVAHHDRARFGDVGLAATSPFTNDEESSGIIDVSSILGPGMYLSSDQAHYAINAANPNGFPTPDELVEGGQLVALRIPFPVVARKGVFLGAVLEAHKQCTGDLWKWVFRADGTTFKDYNDCVSYATAR